MKVNFDTKHTHPFVFIVVLVCVAVFEILFNIKVALVASLCCVVVIEVIKRIQREKRCDLCRTNVNPYEVLIDAASTVVALFFWIGVRTAPVLFLR